MGIEGMRALLDRVMHSGRSAWLLRVAQPLIVIAIIGFLAYELRDVDWRQIRAGLPVDPLFYALLLLVYFMLPVTQVLVYRILWSFDVLASFSAFVRKRILNKDVLGYSGEVYIYAWAKHRLGLPSSAVLRDVRDQNIVSSVASTMVAVLFLVVFLYAGQLSITDLLDRSRATVLLVGAGAFLVLAMVVLRFRRYFFSMPVRKAVPIFAIHVVRLIVRQGLEIYMWAMAMPQVPIETWFTYAAVSIIITRIPFLPSTDLVVMSVVVGLSDVVSVSEAHVFALFGAIAIVNRILNLLLFTGLALIDRRPEQAPGGVTPRP